MRISEVLSTQILYNLQRQTRLKYFINNSIFFQKKLPKRKLVEIEIDEEQPAKKMKQVEKETCSMVRYSIC